MLQIENENETPMESNFNESFNKFEISDKTQNITDYTEQERKLSSSTNNIYQKKQEIKYNYQKKNFGQSHFS